MSLMARYQEQVKAGLFLNPGKDPIIHCLLGLCGEAGEVADLHKKAQYVDGPKLSTRRVEEELGDVLWYLTALAEQYGTTIEQLAKENIAKLEDRHGSSKYSVHKL